MKEGQARTAVYRKDYAPYPWRLDHVRLDFQIHESHTEVTAEMSFLARSGHPGPLVLDGSDLELQSLHIGGHELSRDDWHLSGEQLLIHEAPAECSLVVRVRIKPQENSALEGLYAAGDYLLTQCEPEGFRKIVFFPDRPDVMTAYTVTIEADRERYPVLLSNGNPTGKGDAGDGRHWRRWEDPFPKPSYLFALVAGDLAHIEDHFTTRSGRKVTLRVYVEARNLDRCEHAMESLIHSMRWDEERFGLEYDLDIYNIVATNEFNMGAMENKSLNIFNSKYVLARPDAATDADYQGIEGVIGHEYFHNWTGNRVTCQDWFQLTLKEGLTVFRDEEFSADMQSRAVKRIQDVRDLRNRQFPEDAGPMSHPIRPDHYMEINNFYTATVYQKGAAIIRLYHTLLGEAGFQAGMRLYFERHDGQAVTCDDFLAAMADANDRDLGRFSRWYSQSGTPVVRVNTRFDAESGQYRVDLEQHTPPTADQEHKQPLVIPFAIGLLDETGQVMRLDDTGQDAIDAAEGTRLLLLEEARASWEFHVPSRPIPSLLRDFSAPVKIEYPYSEAELAILIAHDPDPFARWEAAQRFAQDVILAGVAARADGHDMVVPRGLIGAYGRMLSDTGVDPGLVAEALSLPTEDYLAEQMRCVDVDGIHAARSRLRTELATELGEELLTRYSALSDGAAYDKAPAAIARRALRNSCLSYLGSLDANEDLVLNHLASSDNMTDTLAALKSLVLSGAASATHALAEFETRWRNDPLVMDKWFAMQALKPGHGTVETVQELMAHPAFSLRNPNKVRSLIGVFSMLNPTGFHEPGGRGYRFLADRVVELNAINPQIAARMVSGFNRWPRYDAGRRRLMREQLERIAGTEGLSNDVFEIVSNSLKLKPAGG